MKRSWLILALLFAGALTLMAQGNPDNNGLRNEKNILSHIMNSDSIVFGRTSSEWDVEWQQWAYSIPVANHPLFDNGDCSVGQSGKVWFLGGKFCTNNDPQCGTYNVQRSCTIPRGKYLYFPVYNGEDSAIEESVSEHPGQPEPYQQIGYMRQNWDPWAGTPPDNYAFIDGVRVPNLENYLVQSTVFGFTIPADNLLAAVYPEGSAGYPAGTYYPAVDYGEYLMLAPLPPGKHEIKFGAHWGTWGFDLTYFLTVQ